jgi:hypothetical protein
MPGEVELLAALLERARDERRWTHNQVLVLTDALTEEQVLWRPGDLAPSIGFHVWHLARWADYDAHRFDSSPEVWLAKGLAEAWGFPAELGEASAGTGLDDDASARLPLPGKGPMLEYARAAFADLDQSLERMMIEASRRGGAGNDAVELVVTYATHDNRHLGMIEALRGLLGLQGTATN